MSILTFVCAGQMNSAITFPAFENGHEVRLVGSPLDGGIIDSLREKDWHPTLKRTLHHGIKYYKIDELSEALAGADARRTADGRRNMEPILAASGPRGNRGRGPAAGRGACKRRGMW